MITGYIILVLWIAYTILAFVFYHSVVIGVYFDLLDGLLRELAGCLLVGAFLAGLTLFFWKVTLVIIILAGIGGIIKCESTGGKAAVGILTAVVAVMIVMAGTDYIKEIESDKEDEQKTQWQLTRESEGYETGNYDFQDELEDEPGDEPEYEEDLNAQDIDEIAYEHYSELLGIPEADGTEEQAEQYICSQSDQKKLTVKQVKKLSKKERRLAKNEIYARHGRRFLDQQLQEYFDSQDWYAGTVEPEDFDESVFNQAEKYNVRLLAKYE